METRGEELLTNSESGSGSRRAVVQLDRVTKVFGETVAVDSISLNIEDGEFFSLLGPSGCGKTTTLSMIGGFEDPTSGAIHLDGSEVTGLPAHRRDVNTVFQSYALFPHLNVYENVAFGLRRRKVAKDEIDQRVGAMLELVDLPGLQKRKPGQLSGGQQQRVALARALVNRPKLLLLDEPLGALDLKLRKQMQLELKRIQTEVGITFLYVTHDQEEAMVMSDRLAVMSLGHIEQVGPPREVYDSPATGFVAGFLGASNLMPGEVLGPESDGVALRLDHGETIVLPRDRVGHVTGHVMAGVRPEKILIGPPDAPVPEGWASIDGTVTVVAYIGVSHQYSVLVPGGAIFTVYSQNMDADAAPGTGDQVRLRWHPRHTFVVSTGFPPADNEEEGAAA